MRRVRRSADPEFQRQYLIDATLDALYEDCESLIDWFDSQGYPAMAGDVDDLILSPAKRNQWRKTLTGIERITDKLPKSEDEFEVASIQLSLIEGSVKFISDLVDLGPQ